MTYLIGRFDPPSRTCQREIGILIKGSTWSDCEREINEWLSVRYARTIERLTGPPQRPICSWSTCANVLRVMKALQMFQFHWYSKQAGHHSSQYGNKIPRRGYSDIVVLWCILRGDYSYQFSRTSGPNWFCVPSKATTRRRPGRRPPASTLWVLQRQTSEGWCFMFGFIFSIR